MQRLWMVVLAGLVGCTAPLVDGRYTCGDGRCPAGWYCHPDLRCRSGPPPDGALPDGGMLPDVPPMMMDARPTMGMALDPCNTGAECTSGVCQRGPSNNFMPGYCSMSCSGAVACPTLDESGFCGIDGLCELVCFGRSDCPRDFLCVGDFRDPEGTSGTCYPPTGTIDVGGDPCSNDDDCAYGFICASSVCARPCGPAFTCAPSETCRPGPRGQVCLR